MRDTLLLFAGVLATVVTAPPLTGATSGAEALKIGQAVDLDGKLDEPFWRTAKPFGDFHVWERVNTGKRTGDTDVRLAYDDTWLYVGVKCDNPLQEHVLAPKVKDHDGPVHTDESVELFLTSDEKGRLYYHFKLSCFNVKAEQRFLDGARELETWNLPWRSSTVVSEKGWTAEAAIPLYLFLEYGDLDHVRLNVARNQRRPHIDGSNVITHETMGHSIWRAVVRSFHETEVFGALAPLRPGKLQVPFLVSLENVAVKPYFTKNGANFYQVDVTLKGANPTPGQAEVVVTDRPVAGRKGTTVRERVGIRGLVVRDVSVAVPAPSPSERSITVEVRSAATGETLRATTIENPACLKVMDAYLDRNYHTSEPEAVAVAEIGMPEQSLKGMSVAVEIQGKAVASAPAASTTHVRFRIESLAVGAHPVAIALRRAGGTPFCSIAAELVKREPKPGCEVKIDQINRVVLKDGEPFFPFGPVMYTVGPEDEADFKAIADAGCNTFFQWDRYTATNAGEHLAVAKRHGLEGVSLLETGWPKFKDAGLKTPAELLAPEEAAKICADSRMGDLRLRGHLLWSKASPQAKAAVYTEYYEKSVPAAERMIASVKDADNFLAYNSFDEPYDDSRFKTTNVLSALHRLTQRVDGYHPVMLNYSSYIPQGDQYVTCCDILCTDPYWVPDGDASWGARGTPSFVSKIVTWTDRRAAKFRKVVWTIPLGWTWSGCRKRGISGPEQDCQCFLAIIHGAKGFFWFCYPMSETGWNNLKATLAKVKVIGPMAVQPKVAQTVRRLRAAAPEAEYAEAPFIPEKDAYPDVQGRVFRDPKGGFVLLAANSQYFPVTATFTVGGLSGKVANIFGGAKLTVRDGAFAEKLEPFAVRAYRLGAGLREPLALTIAALRPAKLPPAVRSFRHNVRTGKRNVFPNPSLEEETIPGLADYYMGGVLVTDAAAARFGRKCLQLTTPQGERFVQVHWYCSPQHDKDTAYVWSFWAKGRKGGEKLWVRAWDDTAAPTSKSNTFDLTTDWQRCNLPIVMPARAKKQLFAVRIFGEGWLDGVQLEQGYEPTAFEE